MLVSQKSIKFAFVKLKDTVRRSNPDYKNPARYRLDFIKENTFNRVWSLRMTRTRVFLVTAAIIAGGAAFAMGHNCLYPCAPPAAGHA